MKKLAVLLIALVAFSNGVTLNDLLLKSVSDEDFTDRRTCDVPSFYGFDIEDPDTPSPLTVNECADEGLNEIAADCPTLNCSSNCLIPDMDGRGCLMSCHCRTSGLWGDIMMSEEDVAMFETNVGNRAGARTAKRWDLITATISNPKRKVYVVYYTIARNLEKNDRAIAAIKAAMKEYLDKTCIYFAKKPDTFRGDFIEFFDGNRRCFSQLGRRGTGKQQISIGRGCERKGIAMHEMMHAMGFWHEQMRPDRDQHITINWSNIKPGRERQFEKMPEEDVVSFGSPYDSGSVMQYDGRSFSKNGKPTIVDRKTGKIVRGQRNGFSAQDIAQIRAMYGCDQLQASLDR